jgi:ATP/maltotriose-dependent transcriptional regulator MalT
MQKHWKEKVSKLNKIDWLNIDESTNEQERIMNSEKWTTDVKKTL